MFSLSFNIDELCHITAYIYPSEPYSNVFSPVPLSVELVLEIGIVIALNDF